MIEEKVKKIQCQYCAEYISADAEICEYCGENIILKEEPFKRPYSKVKRHKKPIIITVAVLVLILILLGFFIILKRYNETIEQTANETTNMNEARMYFKEKNYDKAADLFQNEINNNADPIAYFYMGRIYQEQGYVDMAVDNFKKAIDIKGDFFEADFELEKIYFDKYDIAKTIDYGEKAVRLKPKHEESLKILAKAYSQKGDSENALDLYKKLYNINSKDYDANQLIGNDYFNKKLYKEALPYFKKAFELNNNSEDGINLAKCYIEIEYYTNAIKILNEILTDDPYNYSASELLSEANQKKAQYSANKTLKYQLNNKNQNTNTNQSNVDFDPYLRELQGRIKSNWTPPKGNESKNVIVLFKIAKDGNLLSSSILTSSGLFDADQAALDAIAISAPFRHLPYDFNGESVNVQFTFDYNVFGSSGY